MFGEIWIKIALGISLAAPPGPVSIELVKRGVSKGFKAAFAVCLGAALGDYFCLLVTYLGLAQFISTDTAKGIVWLTGSMILLVLGYQTIKQDISKKMFDSDEASENKNSIGLGFTLAIANPMSIVWWVGVFSATMGSAEALEISFNQLMFNSWIIVGVMIWMGFLCFISSLGKRLINEKALHVVSKIAGLSLMAFGLSFGYNAVLSLFGMYN